MHNDFKSIFPDDSNQSIGFLFIRAYNLWHYSIQDCLKKCNINHTQFVVMTALGYLSKNNTAVTQVMLAKHINIDVMTLSKLLKKLVNHGYIEKHTHPTDTRAKTILLTEHGRNLMNNALPEVEGIDSLFFSKLSEEKQSQLFEILITLGASQ